MSLIVPTFPISLLQPDDMELLELHRDAAEDWLFLGEVMATALPHLAHEGLVPVGSASATSVVKSLTDGHCLALELRLRENGAAGAGDDSFSLIFRAGIYLGLEDHRYWSHNLMMWACWPDEGEQHWPPGDIHNGALRLAGQLQLRQTLVGRARLAQASADLREQLTKFGSTLEGLCGEFCYRMSESIAP